MISFPFRAYRREANHRMALRPSVGGSEVCCRLDTSLLYHEGNVLRPGDERPVTHGLDRAVSTEGFKGSAGSLLISGPDLRQSVTLGVVGSYKNYVRRMDVRTDLITYTWGDSCGLVYAAARLTREKDERKRQTQP
jgi:hypothetical protein